MLSYGSYPPDLRKYLTDSSVHCQLEVNPVYTYRKASLSLAASVRGLI